MSESRYSASFAPSPWVSGLLLAVCAMLGWACVEAEPPVLVGWLMGGIILLLGLAALGASMRETVHVDAAGRIRVRRNLLGLPFSDVSYEAAQVLAVCLDRQLSASSSAISGARSPPKPRFRIDLKLVQGSCFITASSDGSRLGREARRLAQALERPYEKTGVW